MMIWENNQGTGMKQIMSALMLLVCALPLHAAEVAGTLHWVRRVELSTPVSGVIHKVMAYTGDEVKQGQLLLSLDDRGFRAAVQKAKAEVVKARGAREEASRELDRAKDLYDRTLLSDHELQVAKIAASGADADLESAKADLIQARLNLEYSRINAPFNAVVLRCNAAEGETVVTRLQSVPLLTLAEIGRMSARVDIGDAQLARLKKDMPVTVHVGDRRYQGKVWHIGMEPSGGSAGVTTYPVDILFSYPPTDGLRDGEAATLELP